MQTYVQTIPFVVVRDKMLFGGWKLGAKKIKCICFLHIRFMLALPTISWFLVLWFKHKYSLA